MLKVKEPFYKKATSIAFVVQLLLVCFAYAKIIFEPQKHLFNNLYDGFKNYFTFLAYVGQGKSNESFFHFNKMSYPFGDYVFFTDNTPLLSIPLKFINDYLFTIEDYLIPIHNYFFLFCFVIAAPLVVPLFQKVFKENKILVVLFSIAVLWLQPQILRLGIGHFNLSIALVFILCLRLLFYFYDQQSNHKVVFKLFVYAFLLLFVSGLLHLYYLALLAIPLGIFSCVLLLHHFILYKKLQWQNFALLNTGVLLGGVSLYYFIQSVDGFSALRKKTAEAFDWLPWTFSPEAAITSYGYNTINPFFFIQDKLPAVQYESYGYLGAFTISCFALFLGYSFYLLVKNKTQLKTYFFRFWKKPLYVALFFTMFFSYATAASTYIKLSVIPIGFDNVFSLFYFLKGKVDLITQFRCMGRFSWIGFWIAFLASGFLWAKFLKQKTSKSHWRKGVAMILVVFLLIDLVNSINHQRSTYATNPFASKNIAKQFEAFKDFPFEKYQAIYTIPMVQVGSENYDYTIDDQQEWTNQWTAMVFYSQLPTFNCKMSRTPENQAIAQIDLVKNQAIPSLIANKLNAKPILVMYSPEFVENFNIKANQNEIIQQSTQMLTTWAMDTLAYENGVYYLEWSL